MKNTLFTAIIILLLIWMGPTLARTYRWVDENGVTIYSQSPPPSGKATIIKTPPPSSSSKPGETLEKLKARLEAIDEDKKKKNLTKEEADKEAKKAEIQKQNCQKAKKKLKIINENARIKKKMDDGSYRALPDEERTAELEKTKAAVAKYCK